MAIAKGLWVGVGFPGGRVFVGIFNFDIAGGLLIEVDQRQMGVAVQFRTAPAVLQGELLLIKTGVIFKAFVGDAVGRDLPSLVATLLTPAEFDAVVVVAAAFQ